MFKKMMGKTGVFALASLFAGVLAPQAFASCSSPTGNAADWLYNSASHVPQYCDGTNWQAMGKTGAGGSGCSSPTGNEADVIYNSAYHVLQYCDGTNWEVMGGWASQSLGGSGGCTPTTSNLAGWWKLTDGSGTSAADSSGNSNTGTLQNSPTWTTGFDYAYALSFNGTNQYVTIPDSTSLRLSGSWTVTAWVQLSSLPTTSSGHTVYPIATRSSSPASSGVNFFIGVVNAADTYISGYNGWVVYIDDTSGSNNYCPSGNLNIATNTWYFVAGEYTSSTKSLSLYVNGQLVCGPSADASLGTTSATGWATTIGYWNENNGTAEYLPGIIDDVRVYNVALTATQIQQIYEVVSGNEGDIIFNGTSNRMQFCNGTLWEDMGGR